jgi:hypothetical protein
MKATRIVIAPALYHGGFAAAGNAPYARGDAGCCERAIASSYAAT